MVRCPPLRFNLGQTCLSIVLAGSHWHCTTSLFFLVLDRILPTVSRRQFNENAVGMEPFGVLP